MTDTACLDAMPLKEFRKRHGISRSTYYTLPVEDRPRVMRVGSRDYVSWEAAQDWRRRMEEKAEARRKGSPDELR